jgi:hypothetical protein
MNRHNGYRMRRPKPKRWPVWALAYLFIIGCASSVPPSRLDRYLPKEPTASSSAELPPERPLVAALILIPDTSADGAAPALPPEAQYRLAEQLRGDVNRGFPVSVAKILPGPSDIGDSKSLTEAAKRQGFDFLLLVVLSAQEQEYPVSLFLGWTTHRQPGFRRDNWSLAEAALMNTHTGMVVLRAEGRAMATLDSPTAPGINQWYPVIYLRPQDPERRLWPPTYEGAPITLRLVAMRDAIKRLGINLRQALIEQRESERAWW